MDRLRVALAVFVSFFLYEPARVNLPTAYFRRIASAPAPEPAVSAHSHNDYEQEWPLYNALANRFYSIEADIWLRDDRILISHLGFTFMGTLKDVYLDPLQRIVSEKGSVYGDGRTMILWLEIKDSNPRLLDRLHALLSRYPMISVFSGRTTFQRPVTVVLTGIDDSKRAYVEKFSPRYAVRDGHVFTTGDPMADGAWTWYTLNWTDYFAWEGRGPMPADERRTLAQLVAAAHAKGRKIRFWGTPDNEEYWKASYDAGVDLINTDLLEDVSRYLDQRASLSSER